MSRKKVIITADDFGLDEGRNAAIEKAFKAGIVKSASLAANGREFESAVRIAKETGLDVGVHLNFLDERPLLESGKIPFVIGKNGYFLGNLLGFAFIWYLSRAARAAIELEARAQIEKILDAGLRPSFINSHRHIHMLPGLFCMTVSLAGRYNIKGIRLSNEYFVRKHKSALLRSLLIRLMKLLSPFYSRCMYRGKIKYNEYSSGILRSGHLDIGAVTAILEKLPPKTTELLCHPVINDNSLSWQYGQGELSVLLSPALKDIFRQWDIELIGFKEL